jgi:hypothetical protein
MKKATINGNIITRRAFMQKSALAAAGTSILPAILASCKPGISPNSRIIIAHIGVGDRGMQELRNYFLPLRGALNVAVCDVWKHRREKAASEIKSFYQKK